MAELGLSNAEPAPYTNRLALLPKDAAVRILGVFLETSAQVRFVFQRHSVCYPNFSMVL